MLKDKKGRKRKKELTRGLNNGIIIIRAFLRALVVIGVVDIVVGGRVGGGRVEMVAEMGWQVTVR